MARPGLWGHIRLGAIATALRLVSLTLPPPSPLSLHGTPPLKKALQRVLSEFVRRTNIASSVCGVVEGSIGGSLSSQQAHVSPCYQGCVAELPVLRCTISACIRECFRPNCRRRVSATLVFVQPQIGGRSLHRPREKYSEGARQLALLRPRS